MPPAWHVTDLTAWEHLRGQVTCLGFLTCFKDQGLGPRGPWEPETPPLAGQSHPLFGCRQGLRGTSSGGSWHCVLYGRLWKNHTHRAE